MPGEATVGETGGPGVVVWLGMVGIRRRGGRAEGGEEGGMGLVFVIVIGIVVLAGRVLVEVQ